LSLAVLALGVTVSLAPAANALGVIFSETYNYGNGEGQRDPGGNDVLEDGYVVVKDWAGWKKKRFSDAFDFSGTRYQSIDRFELMLTFRGAGPRMHSNEKYGWKEKWQVRVPGSVSLTNDDSSNDYLSDLLDTPTPAPQTFIISKPTESGGADAFSEALSNKKFFFGFAEYTAGTDKFELESAQLDIVGVVPLPAAVWMLGGIAGLGLVAGRRKRTA
jgi:hypothetical protein